MTKLIDLQENIKMFDLYFIKDIHARILIAICFIFEHQCFMGPQTQRCCHGDGGFTNHWTQTLSHYFPIKCEENKNKNNV